MRVTHELLIIDQVPLYGEARGEFERAYQSIARLKLDLHQHGTYDLPAYTAWLSKTFGKQQNYVRDISAIIAEKQAVLADVREQHWRRFFGGDGHAHFEGGQGGEEAAPHQSFCNMHASWQAHSFDDVEDEGPDEYGPAFEQSRYQEGGAYYDDEDERYFEFDVDDSRRQFEELFTRRFSGGAGGSSSRASSSRAGVGGASYEARSDRAEQLVSEALSEQEQSLLKIKETYRTLARRLHPDANPDLSTEEKRMWHQVQVAYQERDLEQLEVLLALATVYSGKISGDSSLHQLRRATEEVKRLVTPLQKKIEAARKSRAWKFSELINRDALTRALERDFQRDLAELRRKLGEIDAQIQRFSIQRDEVL